MQPRKRVRLETSTLDLPTQRTRWLSLAPKQEREPHPSDGVGVTAARGPNEDSGKCPRMWRKLHLPRPVAWSGGYPGCTFWLSSLGRVRETRSSEPGKARKGFRHIPECRTEKSRMNENLEGGKAHGRTGLFGTGNGTFESRTRKRSKTSRSRECGRL